MKVPVSLMGIVSAGALVGFYPTLLSSTTNDIKNTKHIEIFFYKNNSTSSVSSNNRNFFLSGNYSVLPQGINPGQIIKFGTSTTEYISNIRAVSSSASAGTSVTETARIKIPMDYLDKMSKYEYCFTKDNNCEYKKFSSSETADEIKFTFFSEIAKKFVSVQHYINLIKAKQYHENTKKNSGSSSAAVAANSSLCTCATNCQNCTCTTSNSCNGKANSCCCVDKITALDDAKKNQFLLSISNLVASYKNLYFAPAQAHILLNDFQDSDLTDNTIATTVATSSTSAATTPTKKSITGILLYKYVDYYYKVLDNPDINWISKEYKESNNSSVMTDDFINYPLTLEYIYDKTTKSLKKDEENKNGADCKFNLENVYDEQSDKSKLLKIEKSKLTIQLSAISQTGTISKNEISNIKDILSKVCSKCST